MSDVDTFYTVFLVRIVLVASNLKGQCNFPLILTYYIRYVLQYLILSTEMGTVQHPSKVNGIITVHFMPKGAGRHTY